MAGEYMPRRRPIRAVLLTVGKVVAGIATAISLIVCTAGGAVLIVYLISLLGP
jgi:hypothetical protein